MKTKLNQNHQMKKFFFTMACLCGLALADKAQIECPRPETPSPTIPEPCKTSCWENPYEKNNAEQADRDVIVFIPGINKKEIY